MHGGGMIIGTVGDSDAFCSQIAQELGIAVFSVDYRLAPKYPYPLPMDDCEAGYLWALENATRFGFDSKKLALGGDSAGAGLAAGLVQRLLDTGKQLPLGQVLKYPMLDDRTAANRELDGTTFVWNNTSNYFGWKSYLNAEPGSTDLPQHAVPARRQDLTGLPPTYIAVGEIDLFFAEDKDYADRLSASSVDTVFNSYPGFPHAGELVAPDAKVSKRFNADLLAWLQARFQATAS
ncbi:MAG: alpha/beta hydrolase [Aquiluna sp.]|nr:alpha/beta hydrolase [Aquiluna sp.]